MTTTEKVLRRWNKFGDHAGRIAWALQDGSIAAFKAADDVTVDLLDRAYTTVLRLDRNSMSKRLFTTAPGQYPLGVSKHLGLSQWRSQTVDQVQPFLAATPSEISDHFADADVIASLGGTCLAIVPITDRNGQTTGLLSVAAKVGFEAADLKLLHCIAGFLGPAITHAGT